ncbi:exodeoxyribonuclease V subunit alpha [Acanthopleuribacter pedis]|uniref:Exodeoxyribonuclease V subunit alpha n=1 Tax=Acanthopleuribacter pedis TaxID=442870 RepID=A0A8J7QBA9_9BACT|nr:exodeoxyribonuclease V subunit alpha [Acanthopleuribacter pedis]MBO1321297.1 exodeoxyribonuclease V subunit alpha [Acanthopleuribacter pedis]
MVTTETHVSALGTVMQRLKKHTIFSLNDDEQRILDCATQYGLASFDFFAARKIASLAQSPNNLLLALLLAEKAATHEGNTFLSLDPLFLEQRLGLLGYRHADDQSLAQTLADLVAAETDLFTTVGTLNPAVPFVVDSERHALYRQGFFQAERSIANRLRAFCSRPWRTVGTDLSEHLTRIFDTYPVGTHGFGDPDRRPIDLALEQKTAALTALHAPVCFISGGPGTGKTSIVLTILRLLQAQGVPAEAVQLTAPTGRAANRISESLLRGSRTIDPVGTDASWFGALPQACTVHRLLGWSPHSSTYRHGPINPLPAQVVILDESSMLDILLTDRLLAALAPGTRLIMLGDADQLPSVDAGAVFRDLTREAGPTPADDGHAALIANLQQRRGTKDTVQAPVSRLRDCVVQLVTTFRQSKDAGGRNISAVAAKSNQMQPELLFGNDPGQHIHLLAQDEVPPLSGVTLAEPNKLGYLDLVDLLCNRYFTPYRHLSAMPLHLTRDQENLTKIFRALDEMRVLCLTQRGMTGVDTLNQLFKERIYRGKGIIERAFRHPTFFLQGAPWLITRNDYQRGLFNGDIGISLLVTDDLGNLSRQLVFRTETGYRAVPFAGRGDITLAYAMTVHKSQGSEFGHVVLVLPEHRNALCKKELIYTGLTRAKKSVLIYGRRQTLVYAVGDAMNRVSGLRAQMAEKPETV